MSLSLMFNRRDGLDALLCNDPSFDNTLEKIDESLNINDNEYNMFEDADRISGVEDEMDDSEMDNSIVDVLSTSPSLTDDYYSAGFDMVDDYADEIHDMGDIPTNIEDMEIGDMIDSLM